jgi:hypothetical protein
MIYFFSPNCIDNIRPLEGPHCEGKHIKLVFPTVLIIYAPYGHLNQLILCGTILPYKHLQTERKRAGSGGEWWDGVVNYANSFPCRHARGGETPVSPLLVGPVVTVVNYANSFPRCP